VNHDLLLKKTEACATLPPIAGGGSSFDLLKRGSLEGMPLGSKSACEHICCKKKQFVASRY
jgi:hypothetical protein